MGHCKCLALLGADVHHPQLNHGVGYVGKVSKGTP